ncbi:MAG: ferritin-like domain-containing protein [Acidobacteria bacterium]|nr:ferritin-like domain-containing protein [Acidobacteriota bacterium]
MESKAFVQELQAHNELLLARLGDLGSLTGEGQSKPDLIQLLKIALANEISVSELAAAWVPSTPEWDVKLTLAQQAGDEARHFKLVETRLHELGISMDDFVVPGVNKLFEYLRSLPSTVEKIAAGQFTLESIAYRVNDRFMSYAEAAGDRQTAQMYRNLIQPDELYHQQLGRQLLEKYATTPDAQRRAREAATKTLEIATELRSKAAAKMGTSCFPGC